jgi:hypothetical protein
MNSFGDIAVLTGDVVRSSALSSQENADLQEKITGYRHPCIMMEARFYRGDSFQIAVKPRDALWLALKFRADVKRWRENNDIRISIGIGEVTEWNDNILLSNGKAFELSGKNLDVIKNQSLNLIITSNYPELNSEMETYCFITDRLIRDLTIAQASVFYYKLDGSSQSEISRILNISQPAVSKSLNAADWQTIEKLLNRYSQIIERYYGIPE